MREGKSIISDSDDPEAEADRVFRKLADLIISAEASQEPTRDVAQIENWVNRCIEALLHLHMAMGLLRRPPMTQELEQMRRFQGNLGACQRLLSGCEATHAVKIPTEVLRELCKELRSLESNQMLLGLSDLSAVNDITKRLHAVGRHLRHWLSERSRQSQDPPVPGHEHQVLPAAAVTCLRRVVSDLRVLGGRFQEYARRSEKLGHLWTDLRDSTLRAARLLLEAAELGAFRGDAWWRDGHPPVVHDATDTEAEWLQLVWSVTITSWLVPRHISRFRDGAKSCGWAIRQLRPDGKLVAKHEEFDAADAMADLRIRCEVYADACEVLAELIEQKCFGGALALGKLNAMSYEEADLFSTLIDDLKEIIRAVRAGDSGESNEKLFNIVESVRGKLPQLLNVVRALDVPKWETDYLVDNFVLVLRSVEEGPQPPHISETHRRRAEAGMVPTPDYTGRKSLVEQLEKQRSKLEKWEILSAEKLLSGGDPATNSSGCAALICEEQASTISNEVDKPKKKKGGRKREYDPEQDRKVADAWAMKQYRTCEQLASALGRTPREVRLAVDRHRQRSKRKS